MQSPYKGIGHRTVAIPLVSYENRYVRLFGNAIDFKLISDTPYEVTFKTKIALGEGFKASDSPYFTGMMDRKGTLDVGVTGSVKTQFAKFKVEWLSDVSGHSRGRQFKAGAEHTIQLTNDITLTPMAAVTWSDKKYVDYFYGVNPTEVSTSRPAYVGTATTSAEAAMRVGYLIDRHQSMFVEVGETHWGSGITKSPLVDRRSGAGVRLGYLYGF